METLSYESPKPRRVIAPPPKWLKILLSFMTLLVALALLIALPPSAPFGALDYTRRIPVTEAIEYSLSADWQRVLSDSECLTLVVLIAIELTAVASFVFGRRPLVWRTGLWLGMFAPVVFAGGSVCCFRCLQS